MILCCVLQTTPLHSVLSDFSSTEDSTPLSDIMRVLSTEESISALHTLVTMPFSESADDGKSIVSGANWMHRVNQNSVTTCVLKNYFLQPTLAGQHASYTDNFRNVFAACEQNGLRLCGLRSAYVTPSSKSGKGECGASKFIHSSILSQPFDASAREECHLVLVACFYTPRFVLNYFI